MHDAPGVAQEGPSQAALGSWLTAEGAQTTKAGITPGLYAIQLGGGTKPSRHSEPDLRFLGLEGSGYATECYWTLVHF